MKPALLFSSEHGGKRVPTRYAGLFAKAGKVLDSHRGWDQGSLTLARELARAQGARLIFTTTTRLLVDPNRSHGHPRLFSEWTRDLPPDEREEILARWWQPHQDAVEGFVRAHVRRRRPVLHLSIHSFTPRWKGRARTVDVGFLYDPARPRERAFAREWREALRARRPDLRLHLNRPYRGSGDGLTTTLRASYDQRNYIGFELEVSQRYPRGPTAPWRRLRRDLARSLQEALLPERIARWIRGG